MTALNPETKIPRMTRATRIAVALLLPCTLGTAVQGAAEPASRRGEELLEQSLAYHDPDGAWSSGSFRLKLQSTRPDGSDRTTELEIDNRTGAFRAREQRGGELIEAEVASSGCTLKLDGSTEIAEDRREALRLTCERWQRLRNYYVYMWGLPMKLRDPGTRIAPEVAQGAFRGEASNVLRVTYDEAVGSDVWYFYAEPSTSRLIGYRFYHDEAANDGEYIILEGEVEAGGVRFPGSHAWYMNADDAYLGTDELVAAERID